MRFQNVSILIKEISTALLYLFWTFESHNLHFYFHSFFISIFTFGQQLSPAQIRLHTFGLANFHFYFWAEILSCSFQISHQFQTGSCLWLELINSHLLSSGSTLSRIASQASWTVNSASSFPTASSSGRRAAPTNLQSKCSPPSRKAFEYLSPPLSIPVMVQQGQPEHFALCILPENWFQLIG